MEIERKDAELSRKNIITAALAIGFLTLLAFMSYVLRQHRIVKRKNRVLAREIAEAIKLREKVKVISKESSAVRASADGTPVGNSSLFTLPTSLSDMTNEELFQYIRETVMRDESFLDPALNRQKLTERFSLSKERVGAAFAQGSPFKSVTDFFNDCRLQYAAKLLTDRPDLSIAEVAEASGFARVATFIDNFKKRFALTPTQYRTQNLI